MRAMALTRIGQPLELIERQPPEPADQQVRIKVSACGVCRTDLHVVDGDLPDIATPVIPGHEVVGVVDKLGKGVNRFSLGERVGIPWLGHTCGDCFYCKHQLENLCDAPGFTGYTIDGGYAEYAVADASYCFSLPDGFSDVEAAPLLCAGLIGYRSLSMAGSVERLGIYGFGAAAHIVAQVAVSRGCMVYAFTRKGDTEACNFALELGATWAGSSEQPPPCQLDAAIIFAPVGALVPQALRAVRKGGTVVCGGIHMSPIPEFPYDILWGERTVKSVANLTRQDAVDFLALAPGVPVHTHTEAFPLEQANLALERLREGRLTGAAVLTM